MSREDDSVLSRWSRRKRAARAEGVTEPAGSAPPASADAAPQANDEALSEPQLLEKLGLPDPDTLIKGDDFSAFMKANVPDFLRRRALRRLWLSDPVLANLDGLIDHGEDYTDAAMVPEAMNTVYRVGKGMLRDLLQPEDPDGTEEPPAEAIAEAAPAPQDPPEPRESDDAQVTLAQAGAPEISDPAPGAAPAPRRMQFRTE